MNVPEARAKVIMKRSLRCKGVSIDSNIDMKQLQSIYTAVTKRKALTAKDFEGFTIEQYRSKLAKLVKCKK